MMIQIVKFGKMMLDLKKIRNTPQLFDEGHAKRGLSPFTQSTLELDQEYRSVLTQVQTLQAERNQIAKEFGQWKKDGKDTAPLTQKSDLVKAQLAKLEQIAKTLEKQLDDILSTQPNTPLEDVPIGKDETHNVCIKTVGTPKTFDFDILPHYELGENLKMMDFSQAAVVAGARFVYLKSDLARLERALSAFMLDTHTQEFGYTEVNPPLLVNDKAAFGTAQLPKFTEDLFHTNTGHWLISTAEISLTNLMLDKVVSKADLPLRFTGSTPCFRSEAGAAGRDTRGMIRLHQFNKVELVSIATEEQAESEFNHMLNAAQTILQRLDLPYRVMYLCSGDMGFSARKTYDIEVWLPGQNAYREISSCSYCGDFQGRRMNARYKDSDKMAFVHTFNGSGLPTGRTMVAILENYQNADGSITVPHVLVPYMNGKTCIEKQCG